MKKDDDRLDFEISSELVAFVLQTFKKESATIKKSDAANIMASMLFLYDIVHANSIAILSEDANNTEEFAKVTVKLQRRFTDQVQVTLAGLIEGDRNRNE